MKMSKCPNIFVKFRHPYNWLHFRPCHSGGWVRLQILLKRLGFETFFGAEGAFLEKISKCLSDNEGQI